MQVFIANFGRANFLWPECLDRGTIAVLDDESIHPFWLAHDPEGYYRYAQKHLKTNAGTPVSRALASRWYNVNNWLMETNGDLWLHREKDALWWTWSTDAKPEISIVPNANPQSGASNNSVVYHKKCTGWSDKDGNNQRLHWDSIHKRAREFLFTESTFQRPGPDNAAYALALIRGLDVSNWHKRPEWMQKAAKPGRAAVIYADAIKITIITMRVHAMEAIAKSGSLGLTTAKEKLLGFEDENALDAFLAKMMKGNDICALTGLTMCLHGNGEKEMYYSLDRIDSSGGYHPDNLQLVCRFANRWKGASDNAGFRTLIEAIRTSGA